MSDHDPEHDPSMAGSERIGPYRVLRRLGAGGMGEVVLAHDDRLDRLVAIKRLHHAAPPERRERFRREARIVARLDHPAIVQIHDVHHEAGHDYLIMEYVEGQTLRERCAAGPMSVADVLDIAHQIALGMAVAHDRGVIHRDLKAENVLITPARRAKLTDFGIAKLEDDDTFTADGAVVGTFRVMSPEQALGRPIDHRSDLFSFGILLYEVLSGESPFRARTAFLTVQRLVGDDPCPLDQLLPSIPHGLARLVHHLLAKDPLLRPRDFHEVAAALIELASGAGDAPRRAGSSHGRPPPGGDIRSTEHSVTSPGDRVLGAPIRARLHRGRWRAAALGAAGLAALALAALGLGGADLPPTLSGADDRPDIVRGGWDWRAVNLGPGSRGSLQAIWGSKPDDVYLVGHETMLHYDGTAWKTMDPPRLSPRRSPYLYDIWGSGPRDIFVVGEDFVRQDDDHYEFTSVIWHYDGSQWQLMRSGPSRTTNLGSTFFRVWGSSATDVFVLMDIKNPDQFSLVLHYDGSSWSPMTDGLEPHLTAIWGNHRADVFAVGYSGTIRHYDGVKWQSMNDRGLGDLLAVWGSSPRDVYAVGYGGRVVHYDGIRWASLDIGIGGSVLWSVWGSGPRDVFVAGEAMMHYDGVSWRPVKQSHLSRVWGTGPRDIYLIESGSTLKHSSGRAVDR